MGWKRLQPCSDKQVGGLPEQPVPDVLPDSRVDDVATVGESSPTPSVYYNDTNPAVQFRLAEITRDLASLRIEDDSPQHSCVEGGINYPIPIGHVVDDGNPTNALFSRKRSIYSNDLGPPAKKIRIGSGSLDRISDSPISGECEGDVPAPRTSSYSRDANCYSTTLAVCIASTSSGGESTPMMRDLSSSRDGDNVLNEESSSVRFTAPLQTITSTMPCSSSAGDGRVKDPTVGATKKPKARTPRAPRGSGKIMKDITNHYMKLSSKNKQAFAQRNMAILSKYADENGKDKDCKTKGVGNGKNKKKRKQIDKK